MGEVKADPFDAILLCILSSSVVLLDLVGNVRFLWNSTARCSAMLRKVSNSCFFCFFSSKGSRHFPIP